MTKCKSSELLSMLQHHQLDGQQLWHRFLQRWRAASEGLHAAAEERPGGRQADHAGAGERPHRPAELRRQTTRRLAETRPGERCAHAGAHGHEGAKTHQICLIGTLSSWFKVWCEIRGKCSLSLHLFVQKYSKNCEIFLQFQIAVFYVNTL